MATTTFRPNAYKSPAKNNYLNGLNNISNVLTGTDSTYGSSSYTTTMGYTVFRMIWTPSVFNSIPPNSTINSVTCYVRAAATKSKMTLANAGYVYKDCSNEDAWGDGSDQGTRMTDISVSATWSSTTFSSYSFSVPIGNLKSTGLSMYFRFNNDAIASNELRVSQISLIVDYTVPKYTITTQASPANGGTVTNGGTADYGTTIILTATPNTGYKFVKWSDGNTDSNRSIQFTQNITYTAYFEPLSYTISTISNPANGGTVSGGGTYNYGTSITLTAVPNPGYKFIQWSDDSLSNPRTLIVNASKEYTAIFEKNNILLGNISFETIMCGDKPVMIFVGNSQLY